jgi:hypothetical protein
LAAAKEAIFVQLAQVHDQTATLKQGIRAKQVNALRAALFANAQLPAAQVYEANRRLLNKLAITLALKGTLEPTEFQQLKDLLGGNAQPNAGYAAQEAKWLLPKCESSAARPRREGRNSTPKAVQAADGMSIMPNPAGDYLRVLLPYAEIGTVSLLDLRGQVCAITAKEVGAETLNLSVALLPAGTYFVQFHSNLTGKKYVQKALVQH